MSSKVDAICVDPALVDQAWPVAKEMIRSAMARGGMCSFSGVEHDVLAGHSLLWLAWDGTAILAAAVTRVDSMDACRTGTIVACGGSDFRRFGHLREQLERYFDAEGCAVSRIYGRKGWLKHYPDYKIRSVMMEKML